MTKALEIAQVPNFFDANTTGIYFNIGINTTGTLTAVTVSANTLSVNTLSMNTVSVSNVEQTQINLQVDPAGTAFLNALIYG